MNNAILIVVLRWLTVGLILRVLASILSNYPDYFPPNFESLFLEGREASFIGWYRLAFYAHIFSAPFVLVNGLVLLSERVRRRCIGLHRVLGRIQVLLLLGIVLPSGTVMSCQAFGGWQAGLSFLLLSAVTAICAVMGVVHARRRRYASHRRWMLRCYVLICSAVVLRLVSGAAGLVGVSNPERAYIIAAWCSWLVPLAGCVIAERFIGPSRPLAPTPPEA